MAIQSKKQIDKRNKNGSNLYYILFRIFIQNPRLTNNIELSKAEEKINDNLIRIFYTSEFTKIVPRFYQDYLTLNMKNSNILANGQINIESILLNWTNLIISKQISEYKKYIGSSNSKIENFSKMSQRVIENISKERRKAIIVIAKDVSPSPTLHLRPGSSMPATNRYETLFEHSRCTDKIKVWSRWKEIEDKKQQLKNPKVTKDLQDLLINDKKHDLSEINIRRNKKLYTIFNGTLYFRESWYHQLSSLDQICENNYSRLLLVLSFLIPEYFIDFKKTWLDTKITDVRYEELVILREEINMWSKKRKVNLLMTIINKLEYNVFDGDIKYESKDDDQTSESEESDSKYEYCLKMPFHQVEEKCNKSKEKNSVL